MIWIGSLRFSVAVNDIVVVGCEAVGAGLKLWFWSWILLLGVTFVWSLVV